MKIEIVGHPLFYFVLTKTQVKVLIKLSQSHYDMECRMASTPESLPGNDIGFLQSWKRIVEAYSTIKDIKHRPAIRATFSQLDLTCKILEVLTFLPEHEKQIANELANVFHAALKHSNTVSRSWKTELEKTP